MITKEKRYVVERQGEIWESLEKKYMTQVACSKKFVVGKFLNFKMNDAKPVVKQVEELQIIVHEMEVEGMGINSNFLVGSIIEKLPQSWKNFKLYLKHLTDDMSFEQLVLKIRVEEDNRMIEKADANSIEPNANLVGESSSKSKSNHKNKGKNGGGSGQKYSKDGKKDYTQQKNNNFKKVYHCWVCGKPGHKAKDCRHKKEHGGGNFGGNSNQANHVAQSTYAILEGCFVSYQKVNELEPMFMGNGTSSKIERKGKHIKLTSGKDLATPSRGGKNYYITFIDDCNKFCYVYLINTKDEALNMFKTYKAEVENQLDKKIKILRSDRGGEYESNDFAKFCSTFGIVHQTTAPYIPQQNGVAEQPQTYKALMESSEAPYWKEAIQSEIDSIMHNNTWKLVDLPSGRKPISHKWIFKKKLRPDGTIEKYKAHLVAKGYRQKEDLAYSVSRLSRYSHNPGRDHWDALVRVLQYLKHTMAYGLHYTKYPLVLEGYCDSYVFTLGGAVVSWKSSKQTVNTRSTMEAEFVALDKAAEEAEWLRSFLEGIPLWPKPVTAVCIHCDSMAALTRAKNHIYNGKSRHIRRRHNTIKDLFPSTT
ncbi:DNA polymerase zeta catalytic subunit-like protein [Tanacetum coccineum]